MDETNLYRGCPVENHRDEVSTGKNRRWPDYGEINIIIIIIIIMDGDSEPAETPEDFPLNTR